MPANKTSGIPISQKALQTMLLVIIAALSLVCVQCSKYPTETSGRDLAEQEAVWQYLKTYSIYQDVGDDRVSANAFNTSSPQALFKAIHDTLSGGGYPINTYIGTYTGYDSTDLLNSAGMASATIPYNDTTVIWGRVKKTIADSTAYLGISQFDANTYYEFGLYIDSMNSCRNIIFDLRDNTGGSLSAVDSIIQSILPHNTAYIKERYRDYNYTNLTASTVDWQTQKTSYSNLQYGAIASGKRIVVLTNRYTASAAELMAAALKDGLNATLVGDTSYGKGMGQVIIPRQIWGKTNVKITFLLIQGVSNRTGNYHRKGIVPDTLRPSYFYTNNSAQINAAYDNQFLAAVRVFNPSATLAKIRSQESVTMPAMARRPILHSTPEAYYIVSPDKLPVRQ